MTKNSLLINFYLGIKSQNYFLLFSILMLSIFTRCQSSKNEDPLARKILSADSIVLISHVLTAEHSPKPVLDYRVGDTVAEKEAEEYIPSEAPALLIDGKINEAIILKRKSLTNNSKKELTAILISKTIDDEYNKRQCDMPQHAIVIYINGTQSYIDICFACLTVHTTEDIKFSVMDMSLQKWKDLEDFFRAQGFTLDESEELE